MYCEVRYLSTHPACKNLVDSVIITRVMGYMADADHANQRQVKWQNSCYSHSRIAAIISNEQVVRSNPNPPWNGNPFLELAG